jgi:hypothetical protein
MADLAADLRRFLANEKIGPCCARTTLATDLATGRANEVLDPLGRCAHGGLLTHQAPLELARHSDSIGVSAGSQRTACRRSTN